MNADWFKMSLITSFFLMFLVTTARAQTQSYQEFVIENTKPIGEVTLGGPAVAVASGPRSGKEVYDAGCAFCHDSGAAGSPKIGSKAAWAPRIAKGMDTLIAHAIKGFNAMPPKGMCPSCSDDEIAAAVKFITDKSK